jgi:CubicO group peptidase (beta-lactamase class C family)
VQAQADKIFSRWNASTPGCAVAASVNGQAVVRSAYGMADLERNVPNTPDTIFDAGSVAKQFTAAAVVLLARDGRLSLDDPVRKYVPELPDYGVLLTVRHMLNHTSGLRDWSTLSGIAGWPRSVFGQGQAHVLDTPYGQGPTHLLDLLGRQRTLNFPPGTRWSYSNSGYALAAIIVSRVSGRPFADFMKSRIFEPLGMQDTSFQQDYSRIVKRRAVGYSERQGTFATDMPTVIVDGQGGLLTTVDDLLKWNQNFTQPKVGDDALVRDMQQNARLTDGRTHEYALGLVVDTYRGVPEADHSGAIAGYRAYLSRYPQQQVSIAVLCNAGSANPTAYGKSLAVLLLGEAPRPSAATPTASYALNNAEAARLAGLYRRSPQAGALTIVRDEKGLALANGTRLVPLSPTRLVRGDDAQTFDVDSDGRMRASDEFGIVDVYERVEPVKPTAAQLKELEGRYVSDEIEATFTAAVDGDRLVLRRRPDTTIALTPVYADGFSSSLGFFVVFERDASKRVTGFSLSEERVWNLRFARQSD